jgi:hypothetical protein
VLELDLLEPLDQRAGLVVEPLERRVLHLPPAGELFDQQAAVRTQEQVGRAELSGAFETADRGRVFGHVVGRDAEPLGDLGDDRTVLVRDLDTDPGGPRVTAGRAVAVQDQTKTTIRRQYSHLLTPSVRFRRSSSTAESFSWQAWHTPSTIAAAPTPCFCSRRSS